jgi:hypothetical protein
MNPDYCNCNEFEKAVDYNDIRYYRPEDDRFNVVKKAVGICTLWVTIGPLQVWNHSNTVRGVARSCQNQNYR